MALAVGACSWLVGGGAFWGAVGVAGTVCACACVVSHIRDKDRIALRNQTPDVLRAVERCVESGMTLEQTFSQVAAENPGRYGQLFAHAADMLQTGSSAPEALAFIRNESDVRELAFLAMALDVQHRTGSSLRQVLESASKTVQARIDLARQLETQTTQAKLSAEVVTLLPFGLLAILSLISPGFIDPLFSGVTGYAVLGLAICLQVAGIMTVRRILKGAGE